MRHSLLYSSHHRCLILPLLYKSLLLETNFQLNKLFTANGNAFVLDLAGLMTKTGTDKALDNRMLVNSSLPYALDFMPLMANDIVKVIYNSSGKFKKCLILQTHLKVLHRLLGILTPYWVGRS